MTLRAQSPERDVHAVSLSRGPRGLATARLLRASQAGYCPNGLMRVSPDVAEKSATLRVASSWPPATQMPAI